MHWIPRSPASHLPCLIDALGPPLQTTPAPANLSPQAMSPRQLQLLSVRPLGGVLPSVVIPALAGSVLVEVPLLYLTKKLGGGAANTLQG